MKLGICVEKISKLTFELSYCFEHVQIPNYLHETLHLPQSQMDGEDSKSNKMSFTHPNSKLSDVLNSVNQEEHIGKTPFLYFEFNQLRHLNPNFEVDQNLKIAIS